MSMIFLLSWRLGWTLLQLTLIYKPLVTSYLDKTAECARLIGGGIIVYVKDTQFLIVTSNRSDLRCSVQFRPPNSSISFLEDIEKTILDSLLLGMEVIIIGDLNCNPQGNCCDGRA